MCVGGGTDAMSACPENNACSGSLGEFIDRRTRYSPWSRHVSSSLLRLVLTGANLHRALTRGWSQYQVEGPFRRCPACLTRSCPCSHSSPGSLVVNDCDASVGKDCFVTWASGRIQRCLCHWCSQDDGTQPSPIVVLMKAERWRIESF